MISQNEFSEEQAKKLVFNFLFDRKRNCIDNNDISVFLSEHPSERTHLWYIMRDILDGSGLFVKHSKGYTLIRPKQMCTRTY